jgi:choline-sulfatase
MTAPQAQPNILLITTDQQRFDTIGPHAPDWLRTPHLDQIAREGITFDRTYADNPLCVPSRVAIMSGRSVWQHRMLNNGVTSDALGHEGTLPALMRQAGYQTVAIGKMHFGPERARHGFDEVVLPADYYREMRDRGAPVQPMRHGLGQNELYPGMATVPESMTLTAWLCDQAALYIGERRDPTRPFFMWLSLSKPHPPLDPPEPYYSMYRSSAIPPPVVGGWASDEASPEVVNRLRHKESYDELPDEVIREARAAYYGLVTQVDYNLGRVLAALQDRGMLREAMLMFTSDHGEFLGDHRLGNKILFHDVSSRVPMIVRTPHSWTSHERGSTVSALATHADILPTLLGAAGGAVPPDTDGVDLLALADGDIDGRPYLHAVSAGADADNETPWYFAVTDGEWKYIWYPEGPAEQLFDLTNDPQELHDRHTDDACADHRARLRAALLDKCRAEASDLLDDGDLPSWPVRSESVADRRTRSWPGYHTEHFVLDVRH